MNDWTSIPEQNSENQDPLGVSKYSIRRYSIRHVLLLFSVLCLIASINVLAVLAGHIVLIVLAAITLALALAMTGLVILIGIRSVAIEMWIRRLGMGDFEYRIEPWGDDELSMACMALETLRQNSIRAMQLDTVRRLSEEIRQKNDELEQTLADLQQSQDRVISQQKLAELGEISSGVAHEIRNPIQFIRNFAESSQEITEELGEVLEQPNGDIRKAVAELTGDLAENMERVVHHANRIHGIVSAMMVLDRGTGGGFRGVDLNQLVADQTDLAYRAVQAYEAGFAAEVVMELDAELEEVVVVPEDIARAISNLVSNGCQAMAEKSRLNEGEYGAELRVSTVRVDGGVMIVVRDNGPGMTPETVAKMFNPFFTTKHEGRNTGLGLSLTHDVVREHGGDIHVESEVGDHTEIKVILPTYSGRPDAGAAVSPRSRPGEGAMTD